MVEDDTTMMELYRKKYEDMGRLLRKWISESKSAFDMMSTRARRFLGISLILSAFISIGFGFAVTYIYLIAVLITVEAWFFFMIDATRNVESSDG